MGRKILRDSLLERLNRLRQPRAGSIFTKAEEIAQEYILRDMLGEKTDDIPQRLIDARASESTFGLSKLTVTYGLEDVEKKGVDPAQVLTT